MERIPTIGPEELATLPRPFSFPALSVSPVPFSEDVLAAHAETHLLILTPKAPEITINWFREQFGVDPTNEPCMYNQDWYLKEDFASKASLDGTWHLIRKSVLEETRAKAPAEIVASLVGERFPSALTLTFTFFAWYLLRGEALWRHDFLWTADTDHNGDHIYVGRYEDPTGVNKKGFNIHRHLSLRSAYSAAPEVIG
ncbi:MAG: hypothetical protein JO019_04605 [Candidatus Kaiserbacteria bacterium]|nr:hypothetical protein [Candidatus Kaiserbacteria bacterium]